MTTVTTGPVTPSFVVTDPLPGYSGVPESTVVTTVDPSPYATATRYRTVLAEFGTGQPVASISTHTPGDARDPLNAVGAYSFTCAADDPAIEAFLHDDGITPKLQGCEVQLWRDGALAWWGYPDTCDLDTSSRSLTVQCYSPLGAFYAMEFGERQVPNLYANSDFGDGLLWWVKEGTDPLPTMTVLPDTSSPDGDHSLTLVGSDDADIYGDCTTYATTSHDFGPGLWYSVLFRLNLNSGVTVQRSKLVAVVVRDAATGAALDGGTYVPDDSELEQITTKSGVWQSVVVPCFIPADTSVRVQAYVFAPLHGIMRCSYVALRRNEAWVTPEGGQDRCVWLRRIIYGAQDPAEGYTPLGLDTAGDDAGYDVVRQYPHADRGNIGRAIEAEWVDTGTGDWGVPSNSRVVTFWPDGRGASKPELTVTKTRTALSVKAGWDGSDVRTSVTVQGDGDGYNVDSSQWRNTDTVPMTISETVRAEQGTPLKDLGLIAWAKVNEAAGVPAKTTTVVRGDLWWEVEPGDSIPHLYPLIGGDPVSFTPRVVARTLSPMTDTVALEGLA